MRKQAKRREHQLEQERFQVLMERNRILEERLAERTHTTVQQLPTPPTTPTKNLFSKPSKFSGDNPTYSQVRDWLSAVTDYLDGANCPEEKKHIIAGGYLTEAALTWWNGNRHTIEDFDQFRIEFLKRFTTPMTSKFASEQLSRLKQRDSQDVQHYYLFFQELLLKISEEITPGEQYRRFMAGLRPEIKAQIDLRLLPFEEQTIERVYQLALNFEAIIKDSKISERRSNSEKDYRQFQSRRRSSFASQVQSAHSSTVDDKKDAASPRPKLTCSYCKKIGHIAQDCFSRLRKEGQPIPPKPTPTTPKTDFRPKPTVNNTTTSKLPDSDSDDETEVIRINSIMSSLIREIPVSTSDSPTDNKAGNTPFLIAVKLGQSEKIYDCLVDDGSDRSLIKKSVVDELKLPFKAYASPLKFTTQSTDVSGEGQILGEVRVKIRSGDQFCKTWTFLVAEMRNNLILGYDWHKHEDGKLVKSYRDGKVKLLRGGKPITLPCYHPKPDTKVVSKGKMKEAIRENKDSNFYTVVTNRVSLPKSLRENTPLSPKAVIHSHYTSN